MAGDLYLELHRGTYTTHSRNKRNNRKAEILYREAELWQTLAGSLLEPDRSGEVGRALHKGWKLILLNQFHDIIPGSSIPEVYQTSVKEYRSIFSLGEGSLELAMEAVIGGIDTRGEGAPYVVLNSLGWQRDMIVDIQTGIKEDSFLSAYQEDGTRLESETLVIDAKNILRIRVPEVPRLGTRQSG